MLTESVPTAFGSLWAQYYRSQITLLVWMSVPSESNEVLAGIVCGTGRGGATVDIEAQQRMHDWERWKSSTWWLDLLSSRRIIVAIAS